MTKPKPKLLISKYSRVACDLDRCVFDFDRAFLPWASQEGFGTIPKDYGQEGFDPYLTKAGEVRALIRYYSQGIHEKERLIEGCRGVLITMASKGAMIWYTSARIPIAGTGTMRRIARAGLPGAGVFCAGRYKLGIVAALRPTLVIDDDPTFLESLLTLLEPKPGVILIPTRNNKEVNGQLPRHGWEWIRRAMK